MFVYHFIFRGFMLTLQKKFKKGLLATVFAFTLAQSPAHAVEKPNFMPAQCLGVAGITAVVMGGLLNPEHLRGLIEEKAIDAWIAKNGLNQYIKFLEKFICLSHSSMHFSGEVNISLFNMINLQ